MTYTLDKYDLLGYTIELVDIMNFLPYLENEEKNFSALAYSAYIKSIFIPPAYFLEQPEQTRKELLNNKKEYLADHAMKYDKYCVVVWKENGRILNCARAIYDEAVSNFEYISTITSIKTSFVDRVYVKDGIVSLYNSAEIKDNEVNAGSIININMLLTKPSEVIKATCELPAKDSEVEANKYIYVEAIDSSEYQHIELAINDVEENKVKESYTSLLNNLNKGTKYLTYEVDRVMLELVKDKSITEAMAKKVCKYVNKKQDGLGDITKETLLNYILAFDASARRIKEVNMLRNVPLNLIKVLDRLNQKEDED